MYGSYGSYSSMSMSALSTPIDIAPSNARNSHTSCAFPSWPSRSVLSGSGCEERVSSYLSDDDLFPQDFEDDAGSISSSSSVASPRASPQMAEAELLEMERKRREMQRAMQQEALRFIYSEKERKRQAAKKQRRGSSGSTKKSPKSKLNAMSTITESAE